MNESRLLPLSLILAVLAVAFLALGGVYLSSNASHGDSGPTFTYKEVRAAPAAQPTPFDQTIPSDQELDQLVSTVVERQAALAKTADKAHHTGRCSSYDGGIELCGSVNKHYKDLGGVDSPLGRPMSNQVMNDDGTGSRVVFQRGMIFSSPATGAHEVLGANLIKYTLLKFNQGPLGYPTGSAQQHGNGTIQPFEGDTYITASVDSGVHYIGGRIYNYWQEHGGPEGEFGYPGSDLVDVSGQFQGDGDRAVLFPNGKAVVSSSQTGNIEVVPWSPQQPQGQVEVPANPEEGTNSGDGVDAGDAGDPQQDPDAPANQGDSASPGDAAVDPANPEQDPAQQPQQDQQVQH